MNNHGRKLGAGLIVTVHDMKRLREKADNKEPPIEFIAAFIYALSAHYSNETIKRWFSPENIDAMIEVVKDENQSD